MTNPSATTAPPITSHCPLFPDEEIKCDVLVSCKRVASALSILGALVTIAIIVLFKKYREFTQRLIASLSFAALLFAVSFIVSDFDSAHHWLCIFQAAFMHFTEWAVMLNAMVILLTVYAEVCFTKPLRRLEAPLLALAWGLPAIICGLPFTDDAYGPAGVWCWLKNRWAWRFGAFYIWKGISDVIFFLAIIHIWYVLLRRTKQPTTETNQRSEILDDIRILRVYPIVYFLVFIFSWVNRIYNADTGGYHFSILLLQTLTAPFFGALVAATFALDKKTRQMLFRKGVLDEIRKKWTGKDAIQEYPQQAPWSENRAYVADSANVN